MEVAALKRETDNVGQCDRLGAARPSVEHGDLAKHVAGSGDLEIQLLAFRRGDGEPDLALAHDEDAFAGIAAGEQHFTLGEAPLAAMLGNRRDVGAVEPDKQRRRGDEVVGSGDFGQGERDASDATRAPHRCISVSRTRRERICSLPAAGLGLQVFSPVSPGDPTSCAK